MTRMRFQNSKIGGTLFTKKFPPILLFLNASSYRALVPPNVEKLFAVVGELTHN